MGARLIALQEQAEELGFETIEQAIDAGYEVEYHTYGDHKLVKPKDEQEKAHEAWLEEREEVFDMIDNMEKDIVDSVDRSEGHPRYWVDTLERIRAFIERGEV